MCFLIPKRKKGVLLEVLSRESLEILPLLFRSKVKWRQYSAKVHFEESMSLLGFFTEHRWCLTYRVWLLLLDRSHLGSLYPEGGGLLHRCIYGPLLP